MLACPLLYAVSQTTVLFTRQEDDVEEVIERRRGREGGRGLHVYTVQYEVYFLSYYHITNAQVSLLDGTSSPCYVH